LTYRMETPTLDTGNQHNDADDLPDTRTRARPGQLQDSQYIICWAGAGEPELPQALLAQDSRVLKAGGRASLAEDDGVLESLAEKLARERAPSVVLVTSRWEPPPGELQDFQEQPPARLP